MSFTCTLPTAFPRYSYATYTVSFSDSARGVELDYRVAFRDVDTSVGSETSSVTISAIERAILRELLLYRLISRSDSAKGLDNILIKLSNLLLDSERVRGVEQIVSRFIESKDVSTAFERVVPTETSATTTQPPPILPGTIPSNITNSGYAYANDWNMAFIFAKKILSAIGEDLQNIINDRVPGAQRMYELFELCWEYANKFPLLSSGAVVHDYHTNMLINILRCIEDFFKIATSTGYVIVYHGTDMWYVSDLMRENSIVFIDISAPIDGEALSVALTSKHSAAVILVDTQPAHGINFQPTNVQGYSSFYPYFYKSKTLFDCNMDCGVVVDPCFKNYIGKWMPMRIDYQISNEYKGCDNFPLCGAQPVAWACGDCGYAYLKAADGIYVEAPYDGVWQSVDVLEKFILAVSNCLLGVEKPTRIIWMAMTESSDWWWHACYPATQCLQQLAQKWGYGYLEIGT